MKKQTLSVMRANELYTKALYLKGNNKLLDFDDPETGVKYRYAQVNVIALKCCPFASEGCKAICYATKGNHVFPSVKKNRERSYEETKRNDFVDAMIYTIETELTSKRYNGAVMIIRIHESGDFYSVQYLRKWIKIWKHFERDERVLFVFYTKSFPFFLMLNEQEQATIRMCMKRGRVAMNLSIDETTTTEQRINVLKMIKLFPLANIYECKAETEETDDICNCENCAQCKACNQARAGHKVVKIHSASGNDMNKYDKAKK